MVDEEEKTAIFFTEEQWLISLNRVNSSCIKHGNLKPMN
jgi:hypothetical protein